MGRWQYNNVGLGVHEENWLWFEKPKYNEKDFELPRKVMECLGYEETDSDDEKELFDFRKLFAYWRPGDEQGYFSYFNMQRFLDTFILLNLICGATVLNTKTVTGNNISDSDYHGETIYDPATMRFHGVDAYDEYQTGDSIDYDEPEPIVIPEGYTIDEKIKQELIERSTSKGYTELTALILEKLQDDHVQAALQKMRETAEKPMTKDQWMPSGQKYGYVRTSMGMVYDPDYDDDEDGLMALRQMVDEISRQDYVWAYEGEYDFEEDWMEIVISAVGTDAQEVTAKIETLHCGDKLEFKLDPENTFGENTVAILTMGGICVGYVPQQLGDVLAPLLNTDALQSVEVSVDDIDQGVLFVRAKGYVKPAK